MARFHTTITERGSFRTCRRRWYIETVERLGHKTAVPWNLIFGDVCHSALETYYTPKPKNREPQRSVKAMLRSFDKAWLKEDQRLQDLYGPLYSYGIEAEWEDFREKGRKMLVHYDEFDQNDKFWSMKHEIIATNIEKRGFVTIPWPPDQRYVNAGEAPLLSGRIDLVVRRRDGDHIWDHKTSATTPSLRALDVDDQLTGYYYIWYRLEGVVARSVHYNVLVKEPPHPPKVLASGKLSTDKAQRTTWSLYLEAIKEHNLDPNDYGDMLTFLKQKGWGQFFVRDSTQRNLEELLSFEQRLVMEYQDMSFVIEHPEWAYPNHSQWNCQSCGVIAICQAMEERGNVEYVKENMYVVQEPRVIIPKGV